MRIRLGGHRSGALPGVVSVHSYPWTSGRTCMPRVSSPKYFTVSLFPPQVLAELPHTRHPNLRPLPWARHVFPRPLTRSSSVCRRFRARRNPGFPGSNATKTSDAFFEIYPAKIVRIWRSGERSIPSKGRPVSCAALTSSRVTVERVLKKVFFYLFPDFVVKTGCLFGAKEQFLFPSFISNFYFYYIFLFSRETRMF